MAPTRGAAPACPPPAAQTWPHLRGCSPGAPPPACDGIVHRHSSGEPQPTRARVGLANAGSSGSCDSSGGKGGDSQARPPPPRPPLPPPTCRRSNSGCSPGLWTSREVELRGSSGRCQLLPSLPSMAAAKGAASGTAPEGAAGGRAAWGLRGVPGMGLTLTQQALCSAPPPSTAATATGLHQHNPHCHAGIAALID